MKIGGNYEGRIPQAQPLHIKIMVGVRKKKWNVSEHAFRMTNQAVACFFLEPMDVSFNSIFRKFIPEK